MGLDDKIEAKTQDATGQVKEAVGDATDNRDLEAEGKSDQVKAAAKDAVEDVKDAAGNVADKVRNAFSKD